MIKRHHRRLVSRGFAIAGVLAILAVCAVLSVYLVKMFNLGQEDAARDALGERAYQAARAGADYGAYQSLINNSCAAAAPSFPGLTDMTVALSCQRVSTSEAGVPVTVDTWISLACTAAACPGVKGPAYVERRMQITVAR